MQPRDGARRERLRRARLVDPFALPVAIDADGREIDDDLRRAQIGDAMAKARQHRIDRNAGRDRDQQHIGGEGFFSEPRIFALGTKDEGLDPVARQRRRLVGVAHGAGDELEEIAEARNEIERAIAKTKRKKLHEDRPSSQLIAESGVQCPSAFSSCALASLEDASAAAHSRRTSASSSHAQSAGASAASLDGARRASAQTAMARTRGEASPQPFGDEPRERRVARIARRDQDVAHEARGPNPLDGTSSKQSPKAALIKAKQRFKRRRTEIFARGELQVPRCPGEFVPRADGEAIVAAIDAIADRRRGIPRGIGPLCSIVR